MIKIYGNPGKHEPIPDTYIQSTKLTIRGSRFAHELTTGYWTKEGFLLKHGSVIKEDDKNEEYIRDIKIDLEKDGLLQYNEGLGDYSLCDDIYLHSPSTAAALVIGQNSNGYKDWMNLEGSQLGHLLWPEKEKYF